jgi:SAM-dependent methyltransferase
MIHVHTGTRYSPVLRPAVFALQSVQQTVWRVLDTLDAVRGRRDPLTPPRSLMYVGSRQSLRRSDFHAIGAELMRYLVEVGGLVPDDTVLDVGCGVGRMAAQLTRYLAPSSQYEGFDIVREGVAWCAANITPRFPGFHFRHADVFNTHYNPRGRYSPQDYRFPYDGNQFSFVFLTSVATHMLDAEMQNYLCEIARVLNSGGRVFITYFLLNPESEQLIAADKSSLQFRFPVPHGRVVNERVPESAVSFEESHIRELLPRCGLTLVEPIRYGSWSGRHSTVGYQDIIVATKP